MNINNLNYQPSISYNKLNTEQENRTMTREEAIEILNKKGFAFCDEERCVSVYNDWRCEECDKALALAIKALEREKWAPESYFTITNKKSNLFEIYKGLEKVNTAQKELQENYENELRALQAQKKELETKLQYETDGINSNRIDNAKRFIYIEGLINFGHGETRTCVDDLISDIVNDNYKILKEYYGCKDYDRFICQRSDHKYGFGPKHGDIVFSIRATQDFREGKIVPNEEDKNDILYMLENVKNHKIKG